MIATAPDMYDYLAPHYRKYSQKRFSYLNAVDQFILNNHPKFVKTLLDVGAGDGVRGMSLAKKIGASTIILSDPSKQMVRLCKKLNPTDTWQIPAEDLPTKDTSFDIIFCLWNVLGHIENNQLRIKALKNMKSLLTNSGVIFLDVNNRYNIAEYGFLKVISNIINDYLWRGDDKGNVGFEWKLGNTIIPARGHLFSPKEIESLFNKVGLRIKSKVIINYKNGESCHTLLQGQLVYLLSK